MIATSLADLFLAARVVWQAPSDGDLSGQAAPLAAGPRSMITSISTDTRELVPGSLFVGLNGARFSGADFAEAAFEAGASAVLVEIPGNEAREGAGAGTREWLSALSLRFGLPVAITEDARAALGGMAALLRSRLSARTVAITGSCGKTSTKAILGHMLGAQAGGEPAVIISPKSFNNYIGVPRTLFLCEASTRYAVLEVGTNGPGEIADLAAIAQPDVSMITMIGRAHLEGLGSLEGVAEEKGALVAALDPENPASCAILNADCPMTPTLQKRVPPGVRLITFGQSREANVRATDVVATSRGMEFQLTIQGRFGGEPEVASAVRSSPVDVGAARHVVVPLLGDHAVANVLAALAAVLAMNAELEAAIDAIAGLQPEPHRLQPTRAGGVLVIDDAYNANPESMASAIRTLVQLKSEHAAGEPEGARAPERILVAGAMGEMGESSDELHAETGEFAAKSGIDRLFLTGDGGDQKALLAFRQGALDGGLDPSLVHVGRSLDETIDALRATLRNGDICLVKASRAARLERVVEALVTSSAAAPWSDVEAALSGSATAPSSRRPGAHA